MIQSLNHTQRELFITIFESDTPKGKIFDLLLICMILISLFIVALESVTAIKVNWGSYLIAFEWVFTVLFTIEYFLRIYCHPHKSKYIFSFFGLIDLISIMPTYLSLFLPSAHYFLTIRILRALRIFRILRLMNYLGASDVLFNALRSSRLKITIFLSWIICIIVIFGSMMYVVEGNENGFTSIPKSIYWCIVTLTTVGYGDIVPKTVLGQTLASFIMISGYAIIAVPTGIVTAEMTMTKMKELQEPGIICPDCNHEGHINGAKFCHKCGGELVN
ncbi:MAG: ion transporter [Planctomycetes bacterium]|nr:ion transporter [Planctomycetota bacterium]